jgi:hypothetical protein
MTRNPSQMRFKTHVIVVVAALIGSITTVLVDLGMGYFADPMFPGTLLTIFSVPFTTFSLIASIVYIFRAALWRRDRRNLYLAGVALLALLILPVTPGKPGAMDAFTYRMSQFEQHEYDQLLRAAQTELSPKEQDIITVISTFGRDIEEAGFYVDFAENQPILMIGPHLPNMNAKPDRLEIYWGSGRIPAFAVVIYSDSSGQRCESTVERLVTCLYENVELSLGTQVSYPGVDSRQSIILAFENYQSAFYASENGELGESEWTQFEYQMCRQYERVAASEELARTLKNAVLTDEFWDFITTTCEPQDEHL